MAREQTRALHNLHGRTPPPEIKAAANERLLRYLAGLARTAKIAPPNKMSTMHSHAATLAARVERQRGLAEAAAVKAVAVEQKIPSAEATLEKLAARLAKAQAATAKDYLKVTNLAGQLRMAKKQLATLKAAADKFRGQEFTATEKAAKAQAQLDKKNAAIVKALENGELKEQRKKEAGADDERLERGGGAEAGWSGHGSVPLSERDSSAELREQPQRPGQSVGLSKFATGSTLETARAPLTDGRHAVLAYMGQAQQNVRYIAAHFPTALRDMAMASVALPQQRLPVALPVGRGIPRYLPH
jgi:hypothetical protein